MTDSVAGGRIARAYRCALVLDGHVRELDDFSLPVTNELDPYRGQGAGTSVNLRIANELTGIARPIA